MAPLAVLTLGAALVAALGVRYVRQTRARAALAESRYARVMRDPAGLTRYRADDARLRATQRVPGRVVFLGASITEGMDLATRFPGRDFINRGMSGQYVWQQYLRMPEDVFALAPEAVVLKVCAINLRDDAPPPEQTRGFFARMADEARARGIRPVLATVVPVARGYERERAAGDLHVRIAAMNDWIRAYARAHGDAVLDYAAALADPQGYMPDALSDDGLHPNARGYERMYAAIAAALPPAAGVATASHP
jgi:lysophospholipase L1-like esterase